jgi:DNA-binding LacI/PurR family transcriptional regulator
VSRRGEITIADVAKAAGVSVSTVSRILNHKPDVSEATRTHVEQTIKQLGYTPYLPAQNLAAGKTRTIALLFPMEHTAFTQLELDFIVGAAAAAGEEDYFFTLVTTPVTEEILLRLYRGARADGVILMQIQMQDWRVELLKALQLPFVMIGRCADTTGLDLIDFDFEAASRIAFEYLIGLGHRRIGFLTRSRAMYEQGLGPAVRARRGYEQVQQRYGLPLLLREVELNPEAMYQATVELLAEDPTITAMVTMNGLTASGIMRALRDQGRRVPDDLSVVAVATNRAAELFTPPLTNLRFPTNDVGYQATKILLRKLEGGPRAAEQVVLAPELIVRGSTRPI